MRLDARDDDFRDLLRMSVPVVIGVLIGLLGPSVDKLLASLLPASSVTALDYAQRVRDIALGLLFTPLVSLADVGLSRASARGDLTEFRREMSTLLAWTSFLMLPTAVSLTCLASPVVGVLFMRGSFTAASVSAVGAALVFYAPWLAQFGFGAVVSRGFYALRDSRTPVLIGIWGIAANICLSIILIIPLGVGGIALASTASSTAKTVLLTWFMRRRTGGPGLPGTAAEQGRILLASAGMAAVLLAVQVILPAGLEDPLTSRLPALAAWIASGLAAYLALLALLRSTTLAAARSRVGDLLSRTRVRSRR
jgi:putative peptidoglycan lipid II flippase